MRIFLDESVPRPLRRELPGKCERLRGHLPITQGKACCQPDYYTQNPIVPCLRMYPNHLEPVPAEPKFVIEKHPDGYVGYAVGLKGIVVGEGDTYEDALADIKSAIQFHIETFGLEETSSNQKP